jgi:MYXO-CTERM domain-containing protein
MTTKLMKLGVLAAALALASTSGQAGPADSAQAGPFLVASLAERPASLRVSPDFGERADFSPPAYDAFAFAGEALDAEAAFGRYFSRLFPLESGGAGPRGSSPVQVRESALPARLVRNADRGSRVLVAEEPSLPEPRSWAMLLAGLLGVGAIARRRMSA